MTTVDKALSLLEYFSDLRPEIGLSVFARLSGFDKSAALRMLGALVRAGFVEQDAHSRKYRLGRSFLRFARMREEAFPMTQVLRPFAERIAVQTGETCH
ncbi:MAG: helix-turn-helix domain-containing protein, partial [Pseudomonadota bacterium]|nr:helix-turn-helix domain-containing protein [Pseudomonadota bacterium]